MLKVMIGVVVASLGASAAMAQTMPVSTFLTKVESLEKKGALALMTKDYRLLKAEIGFGTRAVRAEQAAAQKAGRKIDHCLPAKASMTSSELVNYFKSIPAAQRNLTVVQGFRGFVVRKYPCKA